MIANEVNSDFSEGFLGHSKSSYYTLKEPRREIYASKCMKYLTFLDYSTLENTGRSIEAKLSEKDKETKEIKSELYELSKEFRNFIGSAVICDKKKNPDNHNAQDLLDFSKKISEIYDKAMEDNQEKL